MLVGLSLQGSRSLALSKVHPRVPDFQRVRGLWLLHLAGTIHKWRTGDRVMAVTAFGGYSTLLDVPEHQVFPIPQGWSDSEAASILTGNAPKTRLHTDPSDVVEMATVYLTAYYALFELAKPRKGSTVLIHSAAGGVGSLLVKLCKLEGLSVIGVVGKRSKVSYAARCGCDVVIDKSNENLWETAAAAAPEGYSVIFGECRGPLLLATSSVLLCEWHVQMPMACPR